MRRLRQLCGLGIPTAALALTLTVPLVVSAHEGGGTAVELDPAQVAAGGTVVVAGEGMEPDSERVVVLAGQHLVVEFGSVMTDADGRFHMTITIPSHLPSGIYQVQAIGDETVSAELQITGAAGGVAASAPPAASVQPRHVDAIGWTLLLLSVAVLGVVGGFLVLAGERLAGHRKDSAA